VLRPFQQQSKNLINSSSFRGLLVVAKTGAGKTRVVNFLLEKGRVILISPLRALSFQQYLDFSQNFEVVLDTGDVNTSIKQYSKPWDLAVMTYEKFDAILRSEKKRDQLLKGVSFLVIDEVHQIGRERGIRIESAIFKMRAIAPEIKIIGLSATIANPQPLADWLEVDLVEDQQPRVVPLQKHFYTYKFGHSSAETMDNRIDILQNILSTYPKDNFLVFCSSRSRARDLAIIDAGGHNTMLPALIARGVAYHHAGLTREERRQVEEAFLSGKVSHLYATTTLAYGVNLPARHVVLFDVTRWSWLTSSAEYLGVDELNQMIGRAGRPTFDTEGHAHVICAPNELYDMKRFLESSFTVQSQIRPRLHEMLLEWNVAGVVEKTTQFADIANQLFYGKTGEPTTITERELMDAYNWLVRYRFFQVRGRYFFPTRKGKMTSWMYIQPETARIFEKAYRMIGLFRAERAEMFNYPIKAGEVPLKILFSLMLHTDEFLDLIIIRHTKSENDLVRIGRREIGYVYCPECKDIRLQEAPPCCGKKKTSLCPDSRMYKAYALTFARDLSRTHGRQIKVSRADRTVLASQAQRLLYAARSIVTDRRLGSKIESLALMVNRETTNERNVELLKVKGIGETYVRKLAKANIKNIDELLATDRDKVVQIFNSEKIANRVLESAKRCRT
jgi:replicative superfamily II helicase